MSYNIKSYDSIIKELDEVVARLNSKQKEDTTSYYICKNEECNLYKIALYTSYSDWSVVLFSEDTLYNTVIKVLEYLRGLDEL